MKATISILSFALVTSLLLGFSAGNTEISTLGSLQASFLREFHLNDSSISETCGGVLSKSKGGIIHKVLGPIQKNERCVWVIRGGQAVTFSLDMLFTRNDSDAQVLATCIRKSATTTTPTHVQIGRPGPVFGINTCNIVVITFSTGENVTSSATGFVLQYSTVQDANSVAVSSKDYFVNPNNALELRHPTAGYYSANELSTFTFVSMDYDGNRRPSSTVSVIYIRNQLESSCRDFLTVFYFNSTLRNWQPGVRICDTVPFQLITSQDPILLTFETSSSSQYNGLRQKMRKVVVCFVVLVQAVHLSAAVSDQSKNDLEPKFDTKINSDSSYLSNKNESQCGTFISYKCGEILTAPEGVILYKVSESVQRNERCVWILRGGTANYFGLNVHYKQSDNGTQLLASCLRHNSTSETNVVINGTGPVYGINNCNVVLITFLTGINSTNTTNSTGFILQYTALQGGNISRNSRDYLLTPDNTTVPLVYPPSLNYTNDEFSTFVFVPNNTFSNASKHINIVYSRIQLEACWDHLKVYKFNSVHHIWESPHTICDDVNSLLITNQDMILITFKSDSLVTGLGFYLLYSERDDDNICTRDEKSQSLIYNI
ncbi:hypothetical protein Ocin01_13285 [Orchesella cincta]|uniref:CUB domain-containing protein n=1 Tax=Orchesella cincta TaxID=48709 RepID=A0A1D2MK22_ORCCI|nr:hypothetical protein Ocin01_13285 [Orchesella cincta]